MIILSSNRNFVKIFKEFFFPYINEYKRTRLINVSHLGTTSKEYLTAIAINCLLSEIEHCFDKKLINTTGPKIKLQFTDAQGVTLYQTLLNLPIPAEQYYLQSIRNTWIQDIDRQLLQQNLIQSAKNPALPTV
jgi:hypothetical protein